jgi:predicted Ser/Thr protein kinase
MRPNAPSSTNDRSQPLEGETVDATPPQSPSTPSSPMQTAAVPAAPSAPLPDRLPAALGRYQLLKLLGRGGMGLVYLARDMQLDRLVALKVPQFTAQDGPRVLTRFLREARAAATLHHANICPVHDVGEINGVPYLTMAYIEGRSLAEVLRGNKKPFPPRQAAALVRKLALALHEAHRHHVIHRDLKPANVMIGPGGEPIVMDFGLARRGDSSDVRLTQQGAVLGTPAYVSPEQAKGAVEQVGPACDIYSLGVILYELLTHRLPFTGDTFSVLAQVLVEEPPPPSRHCPDIEEKIEAICLKAMAKQPAQRYATMADFAAALTDYLRNPETTLLAEAAPTPPVAPAPLAIAPRRGRWLLGLALAVLVVMLAGAGALFYVRRDRPVVEDQPRIETSAPAVPAAPVDIKPDAPVAYVWPAEALREGKVPAPDLSRVTPLLRDTFDNPASGFPRDRGADGRKGYRGGKYFIDVAGRGRYLWLAPLRKAKPAPPAGDFACQVVGQVKGAHARWGLTLMTSAAEAQRRLLNVSLSSAGILYVGSLDGDVADKLISGVKMASHAAIKRGEQVDNTLLVVVRGRHLEIYVNGVAVRQPILLERALPSPRLGLSCICGEADGCTAEFDSFTLWPADSIPSLQQRGASPKR